MKKVIWLISFMAMILVCLFVFKITSKNIVPSRKYFVASIYRSKVYPFDLTFANGTSVGDVVQAFGVDPIGNSFSINNVEVQIDKEIYRDCTIKVQVKKS